LPISFKKERKRVGVVQLFQKRRKKIMLFAIPFWGHTFFFRSGLRQLAAGPPFASHGLGFFVNFHRESGVGFIVASILYSSARQINTGQEHCNV